MAEIKIEKCGAGRGSRTPKTRRSADFEFHSGFCTVRKILRSLQHDDLQFYYSGTIPTMGVMHCSFICRAHRRTIRS